MYRSEDRARDHAVDRPSTVWRIGLFEVVGLDALDTPETVELRISCRPRPRPWPPQPMRSCGHGDEEGQESRLAVPSRKYGILAHTWLANLLAVSAASSGQEIRHIALELATSHQYLQVSLRPLCPVRLPKRLLAEYQRRNAAEHCRKRNRCIMQRIYAPGVAAKAGISSMSKFVIGG